MNKVKSSDSRKEFKASLVGFRLPEEVFPDMSNWEETRTHWEGGGGYIRLWPGNASGSRAGGRGSGHGCLDYHGPGSALEHDGCITVSRHRIII